MIQHIHNLLAEDFREIGVSYQWMLFHARKERFVSRTPALRDRV